VGSYSVDCSQGGLPAFIHYDDGGAGIDYVFTYPVVNFSVIAPPLTSWTLTAQSASYTIGGTVPTLSAVASDPAGLSGLAACQVYANGDSTYSSPLVISSLSAGTYVIHCTGSPATGYALATLVDSTLTVNAAPSLTSWTLTAQPASYTIGGTVPTLSAVAAPLAGLSSAASCAVYANATYATSLVISSLAAGTYVIHCVGSPATGYAPATLVDSTLTVNPAASTPPPSSGPITYVSHTVSYNLAGGTGSVPASITAVVGAGYTVSSAYGLAKDGYTFGGWTDGAHVYAAGSLQYIGNSDIVLTAIWNSTSDGSGGAAPIVLPKTPVTQPVAQVFTNHSVASNLVANFAKIVDITFKTTVVPVPHDAGTAIRLTDGVQASLADQLNLALTSAGVQVTAVKGWTGRISFPVVATQSGKDVELFVGVEEDPAPVLAPAFSLLTTNQAKISWTANNSQVELYNVYLGNSLACTTSKNTCTLPIKSIANFKSSLKIESVGHQATYSTRVAPAYSVKSLVSAGIVHFNVGSAALTNTAKKTLATLVSLLKALGVTNVNLNGHADATGLDAVNKQLSIARANAVKVYLSKALPKLKFNGKGFSSSVPVKSNSTAAGRSDNRRVEVLVG
jgi:outer membrane protein OmpA-like peptidoglycan-associated protein